MEVITLKNNRTGEEMRLQKIGEAHLIAEPDEDYTIIISDEPEESSLLDIILVAIIAIILLYVATTI